MGFVKEGPSNDCIQNTSYNATVFSNSLCLTICIYGTYDNVILTTKLWYMGSSIHLQNNSS